MRKLLIGLALILLSQSWVIGQCTSDTISNDIIMLVDNSASINNAEFGSFSNIIISSINQIAADCPLSRRGVIHYGGAFGQSVNIEHQLSATSTINTITRQYCLNATCNDGGDDLNYAMGEIIRMINNNELQLDPDNRLSIVVFTDAFSDAFCGSPNCSVTLPTTNVDSLKSTYGANVSVIGMSSAARPEFLAISASPGGNFLATNLNNACNSSFDGCTLPRQYIPVEFTDNPLTVGAQVAALVSCQVDIMTTANVDAGEDVSICGDRGESATLMAVATSGQAPYTYEWSNNLGSGQSVIASPAISTTFTVTITDNNGCQGFDQVRVNVQTCGSDCVDDTLVIGGVVIIEPKVVIDAGPNQTFCENLRETATINLIALKGQDPIAYQWDNNQGTSSSITVRPLVPTTYHVTATDANNCETVDSVLITPIQCSDCFAVAGIPLPHKEVCLENGRAVITTEDNIGINIPQGYEKVYVLTDADLTIVDYAINNGAFSVNNDGVYRIHTLVAEVNRSNDENYFDINLIKRGISNLFVIANCIVDHNICADFDFPGRVHVVLPPGDMMCMTFENTINLCTDGIDNDSDGLVDCNDEDCKALIPCQENTLIACNDLYDNDGDGLVDCFDSDCWEFTRCFEREENCKDGIDNDGDGLIDCEDDSCFGSDECMENSPYTCKDGIDNDRDGLVDCADASCREFLVCAEWGEDACSDGIDNDFDGLVDCADAECRISFATRCAATESTAEFCSDGVDNDSDGLVDCDDPDCGVTSMNLAMIVAATTTTSATCPSNNNGSLTIELGQSGWEYSIDGGETFSSNTSFDNLVIGDYNIVIRRSTGCMVVGPLVTIRGEQCPEICENGLDDDGDGAIDCADTDCGLMEALPAVITDPVCPQSDNGSIRLFFLSGGNTAGIEYSIDGVVWQNSPLFRNLNGGTYNIELRTNKGCTASKTYVLSSSDCPEVCNNGLDDDQDGAIDCADTDCGISLSEENISIGEPSCPAKDNATITVTHNQSGLRYMLDDNPMQDEAIFENLSIGSYLLTVVNSGGCSDTLRVIISDVECSEICDNGIDDDGNGLVDCEDSACIAGLEPTIEKIDASCPLNNNGSITVSGNITGFSFVLNDQEAQSSGVFEDLEPGSYTLRIINASGCTSTETVEITGVTCTEDCTNGIDDDGNGLIDCEDAACQLGLNVTPSSTASSCPDNNDGTIRVEQQQGSMDYSLNGGTFQEAGLFENLSPGNYTLRIRNASACISEQTVIVEGVTCTEICDNGIDDDGDGLIDCEDGECGLKIQEDINYNIIQPTCDTASNGSVSFENLSNEEITIQAHGISLDLIVLKDASISGCSKDQNYGNQTSLFVSAWTNSTIGCGCHDSRALFDFDWSVIPINASISKASITFAQEEFFEGRSCESGPNTTLVKRINTSWDEQTVTYNTAPSTVETTSVIPSMCSSGLRTGVDITNAVESLLKERNAAFGFELSLEDPSCYKGFKIFGDDSDTPIKLHIEYSILTELAPGENLELTDLIAGEYIFKIQNNHGCQDSISIEIDDINCTEICDNGIDDDNNGLIDCDDNACSAGLTIEYNPTDASCPDNNNGSIQIVNSDNSSEYSIDGENFQSESLFGDLLPGNYTLTKRNVQGCTNSVEVTIQGQVCGGAEICDNGIDDDGNGLIDCEDGSCKTFSNFIVTSNPPSCLEEDDGILLVIDGLEGYQYSLSGSAFQLGTSFNGLTVGEYLLTIRNLEGCDTTILSSLTTEAPCSSISEAIEVAVQMDIKVFLEGPFDPSTGTMHTQLNDEGYLPGQRPITFFGKATPPGQPYDQAPWFYEGLEGDQLIDNTDRLQSAYDETIVDWVLVSLRRGLTKETEVFKGAGLLHSNGQIEMQRLMDFTENGIQYFIVIEHRNHLPIMSPIPVPIVQGGMTFDFTNRNSYRSIIGTGQLSHNDTFMMAAGNGEMVLDYSSDTDINVRDLTLWLLNNGENSSYYAEDYDLNGDINIKDRILWEKNNGIFSPLRTK